MSNPIPDCALPVIPVLDVRQGVAVHAIRGQRELYQPVESHHGCAEHPLSLANALGSLAGAPAIYMADLDALSGGEPQWPLWLHLHEIDRPVWIDLGLYDVGSLQIANQRLANSAADLNFIIALESLQDLGMLQIAVQIWGAERVIFSLDLREGIPLGNRAIWRDESIIGIVQRVAEGGINRVIVLDLADVGSSAGLTTLPLCANLTQQFPSLSFITGGGVRDAADLQRIADAGCSAALVATWLHRLDAVSIV